MNRRPVTTLWRHLLPVFVVLAFASPLGSVGVASADFGNTIPSFTGAEVVDYGQALAFVGVISWGGGYQPVNPGDSVYSNAFTLVIYSLVGSYNVTMLIAWSVGNDTQKTTTTVVPGTPDVVTLNLPANPSWQTVTLNIGGTILTYRVATPVSFLPPSIANVGGLDLLAMSVISELVVAFSAAVVFARYLMRRALWAPKFSLLIWGHVVLAGLLAAVIIDYQWVDQTFAGWSPLVYVFAVTPMIFAWALSIFNSAKPAIVLRANAPLAGRLSYNLWTIRVGTDGRGRKVLVQPSWGGFWARVWGHHVPLSPEEQKEPNSVAEPFVADVLNRRVVDRASWRTRLRQRLRRPTPEHSDPLENFDVVPAALDGKPQRGDVRPSWLYWTPSGQPVDVTWPRLSVHRTITVPQKFDKDTGQVLTPEHEEQRLAWPHYVDGSANLNLARSHYASHMSVVHGWRSSEDLAQVLSDTALDLEALKSNFEGRVAQAVAERLAAREALLSRTATDLDETEAAQEAERTRDTLSPLESLLSGSRVISKDLEPSAGKPASKAAKTSKR